MSSAYESGRLILKLFELRRDPVLRDARDWFLRSFHPDSVDDVIKVLLGPDNPKYRMVTGYWDMAASLVSHGAIDRQMFIDANLEVFATFANIHRLVEPLREATGNPAYLRHLEQLFVDVPDVKERLEALRQQLRATDDSSEKKPER